MKRKAIWVAAAILGTCGGIAWTFAAPAALHAQSISCTSPLGPQQPCVPVHEVRVNTSALGASLVISGTDQPQNYGTASYGPSGLVPPPFNLSCLKVADVVDTSGNPPYHLVVGYGTPAGANPSVSYAITVDDKGGPTAGHFAVDVVGAGQGNSHCDLDLAKSQLDGASGQILVAP